MATLRYIADLANDPEKLVEFYRRFLGTEELGRLLEEIFPLPTVSIILLFSRSALPSAKCTRRRACTISACKWTISKQ